MTSLYIVHKVLNCEIIVIKLCMMCLQKELFVMINLLAAHNASIISSGYSTIIMIRSGIDSCTPPPGPCTSHSVPPLWPTLISLFLSRSV